MASPDKNKMYLTDNPINSEEEDSFGHAEYVDSLSETILNVDPPWHIGIFGEWGSGKSSIIKLLDNRIQEGAEFENILCIEFDAWAHAEDSVRTELLLELDQKIGQKTNSGESDGVLGEDEITGRLYDVQEEEEISEPDGVKQRIKGVWQENPVLTTIFVLLGVAAVLLENEGYSTQASVVVTGLLLPVLGYILKQLDTVARTIQRKFLYPRKEWTGAYQRIFNSIIEEADAEKVVISVDNLDRCESQTAYEVLVSLKTFLENDRCIYLIPCDDKALESHLNAINQDDYFGNTRNEREFLRKFFQTHIRIPPFQTEYVEEYAQEQNQELKKSFDEETIDIVANAHFENPRRIKHSINRLVSLRSIAREREAEEILSPGRITDNTPFLAKVSVLEEDFPEFYNELLEDPYLLEDVHSYFNNDIHDSDEERRIESKIDADDRGESRLEAFLRSTRRVTAQNIRPFLSLAEQPYSSGLDSSDEIMRYLKTGHTSKLQEQIEDIRQREKSFVKYCNVIGNELQSYKSSGRDQPMYSIVDSLIAVFGKLEEDEQTEVAKVVAPQLITDPGRDFINNLDPGALFPVMVRMPEHASKNLFSRFAIRTGQEDDSESKILEAFINHAEEIPENAVRKFSYSVSGLRDEELQQYLAQLAESEPARENLVTQEIIKSSVSLVELDNSNNEYSNTESYTQFDDLADMETRSSYVKKLLTLRDDHNGNQLNQSLADHLSDIETGITASVADDLLEYIQKFIENQKTQDIELARSCMRFYHSFSEETSSEFGQWITELFQQWNQQDIQEIFEFMVDTDVPVFRTEEQADALLNRVPNHVNDEDFVVDEVIPCIPTEFNPKIASKAKALIRINNNTRHQELGLAIVENRSDRLEESFGPIIEECGRQVNKENNSNVKKKLLMPVAQRFSELDGPEQENFINQMENLLRGNAGDYETYRDLWTEFEKEADSDRQDAVAGDVLDELDQRIGSQHPEHLTPLFDVLESIPDGVDKNRGSQLLERLSDRLTDNLNPNQQTAVIEQIAGFNNFYGREEQIVDRLENILMNMNNNNVQNASKDLLKQIEETETVDSERLKTLREAEL